MRIRMKKKGQEVFGMSYGVIFAILIIIATLAVAIYGITAFVQWNECRQLGTFYDSFQREVRNAWSSDNYCDTFPQQANPLALPGGIEYVCFGSLTQEPVDTTSREKQAALKELNADVDKNFFFYPIKSSCRKLTAFNIDKAEVPKFICRQVTSKNMEKIFLSHNSAKNPLTQISTRCIV